MKDEALRLALEGFEKIKHHFDTDEYAYEVAVKSITAIKQALEQPEPEPVAILHRYPSKCRMTVEYTDEITEVREGSWPLYTTPPQSKPLTDEEIILIVAECAASHQHTDIHFARAIERAHGIEELV